MKKLFTILMIALSLTMGSGLDVMAEPTSSQVTVSVTEEGKDIREESPWGYRKPSPPIRCTIDFNTLSITLDRIPIVLSYELWDEDGENMVISYSTDYDMVSYISSLSGVYRLRLVCAEKVYIGYIEF